MKKIIQGKVIRNNLNKTIVVAAISSKFVSKYLLRYKVTKRYFVHDEYNTSALGNIVTFVESRPFSKLKKWNLLIG